MLLRAMTRKCFLADYFNLEEPPKPKKGKYSGEYNYTGASYDVHYLNSGGRAVSDGGWPDDFVEMTDEELLLESAFEDGFVPEYGGNDWDAYVQYLNKIM
jgi:hypothetical protein